VTEVSSIHSARWINQLKDTGWDLHVFQGVPINSRINPAFECGTFYLPYSLITSRQLTVHRTLPSGTNFVGRLARLVGKQSWINKVYHVSSKLHANCLASLIKRLRPDVVHLHGLCINWNNMGLVVLRACQILGGKVDFPWLYSSWGADLDLYARQSPAHLAEVESILSHCDYHIAECDRDALLAREMKFRGESLSHMPAFGGVNWDREVLSTVEAPSGRKLILLKGRDVTGGDPQGRALTALRAFELCGELLNGYRIVIGHAAPSIIAEAAVLSARTGIDIRILPNLEHHLWLKAMGGARIFISLTVSDGLPSSLVEAMSLGALPIHSDLDSIREWVRDGRNGFLVPPEDPEAVAAAIEKAVTDDDLVDRAAATNEVLIRERLSDSVVRPKAIEIYERVVQCGKVGDRN
jgi:glycosyltransferase involved in cell wall biosynthesis